MVIYWASYATSTTQESLKTEKGGQGRLCFFTVYFNSTKWELSPCQLFENFISLD
jgi:hypothetical protein